MTVFIALLSAFSIACYFVYVSYVMKKQPRLSSGLVLAIGHTIAAMVLLPLFIYTEVPDSVVYTDHTLLLPLVAAALLLIVSRQLYYYAYANAEVAHITIFSSLTPVYALGTGYILLGEIPNSYALIGLLLIVGGIYSIFLKRDPHLSLLANIFSPLGRIFKSRPIAMAFFSTIPTAFAAVFQKQLLSTLTPIAFSFYLLLIIGIISFAIEIIRASKGAVRANIALLPWHFLPVSAVLLATTHVLFCVVMLTQQTAISLVLQRSGIVFQILLAYYFIGEKADLPKRVLAALVIMTGFGMIMLGTSP